VTLGLDRFDTPVQLLPKPKGLYGITELGPERLALESGQQYRFSFNMGACIGCHSCEVACAEQNGLPPEVSWRRVGEVEGGSFPTTKRFHLSLACNHCLEPACLEGCPTGAYTKLDNGIVKHHADDCIGCQYCTWNCPYSVPAFQPDRRIVTKCDMCQPRLESGGTSACVDACPTHAIGIEVVDIAAWRLDHHEADGPNMPPSELTISTTRIILPDNMPMETFAVSDHDLRPEHPHWPLVWVTLLTQLAMGAIGSTLLAGVERHGAIVAFLAASVALPASLLHLGRPAMAWKALRGLRRSWLSREVLFFGLLAVTTSVVVVMPTGATAGVALAMGVAGVYSSGRLYVVPGRPAWNTPLTIASFLLSGAATGPLLAMTVTGRERSLQAVSIAAIAVQLIALAINLLRLRDNPAREYRGSYRLMTEHFGRLLVARVALAAVATVLVCTGPALVALPIMLLTEAIGRYLFFVTVVPLSAPGGFFVSR
jgi:formate dehydrogenase iron-sulfur subunit